MSTTIVREPRDPAFAAAPAELPALRADQQREHKKRERQKPLPSFQLTRRPSASEHGDPDRYNARTFHPDHTGGTAGQVDDAAADIRPAIIDPHNN